MGLSLNKNKNNEIVNKNKKRIIWCRPRSVREIQILDSDTDSKDNLCICNNNNSHSDQLELFPDDTHISRKDVFHNSHALLDRNSLIANELVDRSNIQSNNDHHRFDYNFRTLSAETRKKSSIQSPFKLSNEDISFMEDDDVHDVNLDDNNIYIENDAQAEIRDIDESLEYANTQTSIEDSINQNSLSSPDEITKNSEKPQDTKHVQHDWYPSSRSLENNNFHMLMRALARKYWRTSPKSCLTVSTSIDAPASRNRGNGITVRKDGEDDTFTSVTELSNRDNSLFHDKNNFSQKLTSSVNRMQPIVEENSSPQPNLNENEYMCHISPKIRPHLQKTYKRDQLSNMVDHARHDIDIQDDENTENENGDHTCPISCGCMNRNIEYGEKQLHDDESFQSHIDRTSTKAIIIKLSMPIHYIYERMMRSGIKVFCYRFWVDDDDQTWSAFHCQKDRRIESIGRATSCHIRLRAIKTRRQPNGLIKQQVVVYAPSLMALEKCCNLFDDKFPVFYASSDFQKVKQLLQSTCNTCHS